MLLLPLLACAPYSSELLLTGWEYEWEELSHRVSYIRIGVEEDSSLALGLVGGDWSTGATFTDTPNYRVRYQRVTAPGLQVVRGTTALQVGPDPTGTTSIVLDGADLPEGASLVAVIDGFWLDTAVPQPEGYPAEYDPAFGYTSNGFGIALGTPERSGGSVTVPIEATVRWGPQDREDVNAAIPFAVTEVGVDVALLAFDGDLEALSLTGDRPYDTDPANARPFTDQPPMELPAAFDGGAREGFVAWRSFDLQLNLAGTSVGEGDYLRAFGVEAVPTQAGPASWDGSVTATMSTSSLSEWSDPHAGFAGDLVYIGLRDVVAEHFVASGSHPTGLAETGPTLAR